LSAVRLSVLKPELPESLGLDLPNNFIVVRSAVKAKEKSREGSLKN